MRVSNFEMIFAECFLSHFEHLEIVLQRLPVVSKFHFDCSNVLHCVGGFDVEVTKFFQAILKNEFEFFLSKQILSLDLHEHSDFLDKFNNFDVILSVVTLHGTESKLKILLS